MAGMRYQPQGRLSVRPEWVQRGLVFAWVASQPAVNAVKSASSDVRVGELVYAAGPRGIAASSFSYPSLGNRLIADSRITGFSGTGTFIAGGTAAGDGTFMSIGTAGQGVRTSIRAGNAAMTYMGVADYGSSIAMPNGPVALGVAIGKNSAALVARTNNGVATQTLALGNPVATTQPLRIGSTGASDNWPGSMEFGYYFTQTLTAAELRELVNNPWALFADPYEDDEIAAPAGSPGGISATLAATLAPAALAASGQIAAAANLSGTLAGATLTATAAAALAASLAKALDPAQILAAASAKVAGTLAQTLAPATLTAAASLGAPQPAQGDVNVVLVQTLADASLVASGKLAAAASLNKTLAPAALTSVGTIAGTASLAGQLAPVALAAQAGTALSAMLSAALDGAILSARARFVSYDTLPAPGTRSWRVEAESRTLFVPADPLSNAIAPEPRTLH